MVDSLDIRDKFSRLLDQKRPHEVLILFLEGVGDNSRQELTGSELVLLDVICREALPQLLEARVPWLVKHPDQTRRLLELLITVQGDYRPAATLDHIAWLRCLLAISEPLAGCIERVHQELSLVAPAGQRDPVPQPNGMSQREIEDLAPTEEGTVSFLEPFFSAYREYLHRAGRHELANHLQARLGRLLDHIARDERRPGVVQALFYDQSGIGQSRFLHVSTERLEPEQINPPDGQMIHRGDEKDSVIDAAMSEAAVTQRPFSEPVDMLGFPLTEREINEEEAF